MMVDLDAVYAILHSRDVDYPECDRVPLATVVGNYSRVVKELLSKPKVKAYSMPFVIQNSVDPFDKTPYLDVYLRNKKYVKPPKGKEPWGGVRGKKIPKGKYNANLSKYNLRYSLMGVRWSKLIDTPIENEAGCSHEQVIATLLWELTFDGWTEAKAAENTELLKKRLTEATKEIKAGKCITLPPKKKGGMKVVIPDSVNKQIMDIINKPVIRNKTPNTCKTCWGYGLWAMGDASPMGPMDATDGMPTKVCPECGANPNPIK
jgi:hypothetical protein